MSDEASSIVMGYTLTLAPARIEAEVSRLGGDGQGELINALSRTPLARAERSAYRKRDVDTSYLSRIDSTDYCRWVGRKADGCFHPISRIMRIVKVDPSPITAR